MSGDFLMPEWEILKTMTPGSWGIWTLVLLAFGAMVKVWPSIKKLQNEADGSLRHDLLLMIADLRRELAVEKQRCSDSEEKLNREIGQLHGQIHELRNSMVELTLAAGRTAKAGGAS